MQDSLLVAKERFLAPLKRRCFSIALFVLSACVLFLSATTPTQAGSASTLALARSRIKYVFVLYQENRSYDSYFGTFPGGDGLYANIPRRIAGFEQPIQNIDGSLTTVRPFRIGPAESAANTDDVGHAHGTILSKMDIVNGVPQMDRFALTEERKWSPTGNPTLRAKQFAELSMAHEDCDTIPILWNYAKRFVLFDHVFQNISGPSTPGNLSIIGAQTGITQWLLHPDEAAALNGDDGPGVPVVNDSDPFWGSPADTSNVKMPVNAGDFPGYSIQRNLTYATLPLTMQGRTITSVAMLDSSPASDLLDVHNDLAFLGRTGVTRPLPWGWFEEGYNREITGGADPTDAEGRHASYVTHHNGPQYFGYIANNAQMRAHLHGLADLWSAIDHRALGSGGVYYLKGGYRNILKLVPSNHDPQIQKTFLGDDDHPGYSDAQISEAMIAETINKIANSPYWKQSAIVLTWDDSVGDYDHVSPPMRNATGNEQWVGDGPRVPLIIISPFAKANTVVHDFGDQGSVVKLIDQIFDLTPLADLPDEQHAAKLGLERFGIPFMGPTDARDNGVSDLLAAFDVQRLSGSRAELEPSYVKIQDNLVMRLPQESGFGCSSLNIVPTDRQLGIVNEIPADFNPRPKTNPSAQ